MHGDDLLTRSKLRADMCDPWARIIRAKQTLIKPTRAMHGLNGLCIEQLQHDANCKCSAREILSQGGRHKKRK